MGASSPHIHPHCFSTPGIHHPLFPRSSYHFFTHPCFHLYSFSLSSLGGATSQRFCFRIRKFSHVSIFNFCEISHVSTFNFSEISHVSTFNFCEISHVIIFNFCEISHVSFRTWILSCEISCDASTRQNSREIWRHQGHLTNVHLFSPVRTPFISAKTALFPAAFLAFPNFCNLLFFHLLIWKPSV